jgi:hypothetical protein
MPLRKRGHLRLWAISKGKVAARGRFFRWFWTIPLHPVGRALNYRTIGKIPASIASAAPILSNSHTFSCFIVNGSVMLGLLATVEPQLPAGHDSGTSYIIDDLADHSVFLRVTASFLRPVRWGSNDLNWKTLQGVIRNVLRQAKCHFWFKLMRIGEHADWSPKIYTINRNRSKRSELQFSIYRLLRNERNPESFFKRRLDRIDVIDLQSKSPVRALLKDPLFGESPGGRFRLTHNESFFTELVQSDGRTASERMIFLNRQRKTILSHDTYY